MHNAFAHQLLKLRTEQQLSQTDIANLLFVSRQAVSKWENGDTEPNLDNLIALARILNVSLENLITGSSNPNSLLLTLSHVSKISKHGPTNAIVRNPRARALIFWNLDELCPTLFQKTVFQYPVLAANLLNKGLKVLNISLRMFCHELL